jgi:hypothetical protein
MHLGARPVSTLLLLGSLALPTTADARSKPAVPPIEVLGNAGRFGARLGRGRALMPEARAFVRLFQEGAHDELARLLGGARPAARMFGLCALYRRRDPGFAEAVARLAASDETVKIAHGCILDELPVSRFLRGAAEGKRSSYFIAACREFPLPRERH